MDKSTKGTSSLQLSSALTPFGRSLEPFKEQVSPCPADLLCLLPGLQAVQGEQWTVCVEGERETLARAVSAHVFIAEGSQVGCH